MRNRGYGIPVMAMGTAAALLAVGILVSGCGSGHSSALQDKTELGRALFNDTSLSQPGGQSCATCHQSVKAFADARQDTPTSEGAVAGLFGKRQTPSIDYMAFSPPFHFDNDEQDYIGGQFWDGRAVDLKDQVHFPIVSAFEMHNATKADVATRVSVGPLASRMKQVYGANIFNDPVQAFDAIADAIATFESSREFSPFSSKYDRYLQRLVKLTPAELRGLELFKGKALCANCHPSDPGPEGAPPLFTDFTYDNIGLPKNMQNRFLTMPPDINPDGQAFADMGLMQTTHRPDDVGRMKVPTLRNIALTAPYFHNGVFKTLEEVVQFYNKRDLGGIPPPEFPDNMNTEELGNLHLTDQEVSDIVAFLKTLTDNYSPTSG